jgi:hypothetical protein
MQFLNDFLHSSEVQTIAIFEILSARGTKRDLHWLSVARTMLVYKPLGGRWILN